METAAIVQLRYETADNGEKVILADISGEGRVVLGVLAAAPIYIRQGGVEHAAYPIKPKA